MKSRISNDYPSKNKKFNYNKLKGQQRYLSLLSQKKKTPKLIKRKWKN